MVIFPQLIPMIKKEFVKSESIKVILVPIFLTIIVDYIIELSRYFPILIGGEMIKVGTDQVISHLKNYTISSFIFMGLYPAVLEEFLFRFVPFCGIKLFFQNALLFIYELTQDLRNKKIVKVLYKTLNNIYIDLYVKKQSPLLIILIVIISTAFSLIHGTDITNFYCYFIYGLLFCYYYLKYGYLSCVIGHAIGNYLTLSYTLAKITARIVLGIS